MLSTISASKNNNNRSLLSTKWVKVTPKISHFFGPGTFDSWGVLPYQGVGGLGPHIKFGGKIWGKIRPSSSNKRKNFGTSEKSQFWGQI